MIEVRDVRSNKGIYTFLQSDTEYEYHPSTRDLYRLGFVGSEPSLIYVGKVNEVHHTELITALSQGAKILGPYLPSEPDPTFSAPNVPGVPSLNPPRWVPDPAAIQLGKVPDTHKYRIGNIGVIPGISPVRWDKSYRPKTVNMDILPDTAQGMWEFIRNVVGEQIRQTPSPVKILPGHGLRSGPR